MPTFNQRWEEFLSGVYSQAIQEFRRTQEYSLVHEKVEEIRRNCRFNYLEEEYIFFEDWMEAQARLDSQEGAFLYRRGTATAWLCSSSWRCCSSSAAQDKGKKAAGIPIYFHRLIYPHFLIN